MKRGGFTEYSWHCHHAPPFSLTRAESRSKVASCVCTRSFSIEAIATPVGTGQLLR